MTSEGPINTLFASAGIGKQSSFTFISTCHNIKYHLLHWQASPELPNPLVSLQKETTFINLAAGHQPTCPKAWGDELP